MRYLTTSITLSRIVGAFILLFVKPLSISFYVIFALCAISDAVDGTIARKTGCDSKAGEVLDSVADFIFIVVVIIALAPSFSLSQWMHHWIRIIVILRMLALIIGLAKFKAFAGLHTYANKASGGIMYTFPLLYHLIGFNAAVIIICAVASISVLEEIIITINSKDLDRNITGILDLKMKSS